MTPEPPDERTFDWQTYLRIQGTASGSADLASSRLRVAACPVPWLTCVDERRTLYCISRVMIDVAATLLHKCASADVRECADTSSH